MSQPPTEPGSIAARFRPLVDAIMRGEVEFTFRLMDEFPVTPSSDLEWAERAPYSAEVFQQASTSLDWSLTRWLEENPPPPPVAK